MSVNGAQGGDAISELYRIADEWASKELSNVILDEFSRYISNAISGKGNNERVSLFLGAYAWHHKADYFTGEWTTSYIGINAKLKMHKNANSKCTILAKHRL